MGGGNGAGRAVGCHPAVPFRYLPACGSCPDKDRTRLLAYINDILNASSFRHEKGWARVMDGQDEGVYGWLAVNYLLGRLQAGPVPQQMTAPGPPQPPDLDTLGVLDLGGSSLEVTYLDPSGTQDPLAQHVDVVLMGVSYRLSTHTLHEYGLNDAFARSISVLLREETVPGTSSLLEGWWSIGGKAAVTGSAPVVHHPCLHEGYDAMYKRSSSGGLPPDPREVQLVAKPSWEACVALVEAVLNATEPCGLTACPQGSPSHLFHGGYYGVTGFFVVYKFFGLTSTAGPRELEEQGRRHCSQHWDALQVTGGYRVPSRLLLLPGAVRGQAVGGGAAGAARSAAGGERARGLDPGGRPSGGYPCRSRFRGGGGERGQGEGEAGAPAGPGCLFHLLPPVLHVLDGAPGKADEARDQVSHP
eukprot:jgi/Botrbrau1/890/Bobra.0167s0013.1